MRLQFPYGRKTLSLDIPDERVRGVLSSGLERYDSGMEPSVLMERALANPVGSPPLSELARGKRNIVLLASDHTRPVPSRVLVPPMLRELRRGNPDAEITILIATGCHRGPTKAELSDKFGAELVAQEHIVVHDCDKSEFVKLICFCIILLEECFVKGICRKRKRGSILRYNPSLNWLPK